MTEGALPVLKPREVIRAPERDGFARGTMTGSHQKMVRSGPPRVVVPVPIHGGKDIRTGVPRSIIRQAGMTVEEFTALL